MGWSFIMRTNYFARPLFTILRILLHNQKNEKSKSGIRGSGLEFDFSFLIF